MSATKEKPKRPYDPGTPAGIETMNYHQGLFLVKPFRKANGEQKDGEYLLDLIHETCTCPNHEHRIAPVREAGGEADPCKHYDLAREHSFKIALSIARQLSAANLRTQLLRADLRPEIHEAVCRASWERVWARMNTRPGSLPLRSVIETVRRAGELIPA